MISKSEQKDAQTRAAQMMRAAGIQINDSEVEKIEVVEFGLSRLSIEGVHVLTMVNTDRLAAKALVLFPGRTEPVHWHSKIVDDPGKQETIRHIWGDLRFYVEGSDTLREGFIVPGQENV